MELGLPAKRNWAWQFNTLSNMHSYWFTLQHHVDKQRIYCFHKTRRHQELTRHWSILVMWHIHLSNNIKLPGRLSPPPPLPRKCCMQYPNNTPNPLCTFHCFLLLHYPHFNTFFHLPISWKIPLPKCAVYVISIHDNWGIEFQIILASLHASSLYIFHTDPRENNCWLEVYMGLVAHTPGNKIT